MPMFGHNVNQSNSYYYPLMRKNMNYYPNRMVLNGQFNIRQQPFQINNHLQQWNWNPFQGQIPYFNFPQHLNANSYPSQGFNGYEPYYYQNHSNQKNSHSLFQNPLHSWDEPIDQTPHSQAFNSATFMNPYPKQSYIPQQSIGMKSIINSFKSQDGSLDINKMIDTAGQMMNAVNQVSGLVKGFGGIFKV